MRVDFAYDGGGLGEGGTAVPYRDRVTKGSPFICHQGEIRLRADAEQTELT